MKLEPGWPKMEPEFTKNGGKIEKNALNRPKWLPDSSQDHFGSMMVTSLGGFLGPLGVPKIDQKSTFWENGCSKERFFIDFCGKCRFSRFFGGFLVDLPLKIDGKTDVFCHNCACFFQTGDPHETLYFTIRKLLFRFLSFWFFLKNRWKKRLKISLAKKVEKWPPGDPKMDPKSSKNGRSIAKNP